MKKGFSICLVLLLLVTFFVPAKAEVVSDGVAVAARDCTGYVTGPQSFVLEKTDSEVAYLEILDENSYYFEDQGRIYMQTPSYVTEVKVENAANVCMISRNKIGIEFYQYGDWTVTVFYMGNRAIIIADYFDGDTWIHISGELRPY